MWWPITYHIRTIHIIKGNRLCTVLIIEGQHDFIIIHEHGINKAINQSLPLGFIVYIGLSILVDEKGDLLTGKNGVFNLLH